MRSRFTPGLAVQTRFGKGVVREVRNNRRLLVDVNGRALVVREQEVAPVEPGPPRRRATSRHAPSPRIPPLRDVTVGRDVDLHGLTVQEALAHAERALNEAMLANLPELRLIHGRSGGKIRAALHRWLQEISSIDGFQLDPRNDGVTVVRL